MKFWQLFVEAFNKKQRSTGAVARQERNLSAADASLEEKRSSALEEDFKFWPIDGRK